MKRIYIIIVLTAIFAGIFAGCEDQEYVGGVCG